MTTQSFTYTARPTDEVRDSPIDHFQIQRNVDEWAIWRDARMWDDLEGLWHPEGKLVTTWTGLVTQAEFSAAAQKGYDAGDRMLHSNGGCTTKINGTRAVSQTKLRIMQRDTVHGVLSEVVCIGRDYDFHEYKDGKWAFVLRQPIYERDWITPVSSAETVDIPASALEGLPEGYAYLTYLLHQLGYEVNLNLPTHDGESLDRLYAAGQRWLDEGVIDWSI